MRRFGITAVFPGKNLSNACKYHKKYPYLLRNKVIRYPNHQVWSTDITYIKLPTGNVYLMAIIDWFSRKVLSWRVFNTMDALQYANLLRETIEEYGCPAIFNTDQGSQFTSDVFIKVLVDYDIQISMDGKDRALDNIRIERLWRSLKYEDIYLKRYETMKDLKAGINAYFNFYNTARFISRWITTYLMKCINASNTMNWNGNRLHKTPHCPTLLSNELSSYYPIGAFFVRFGSFSYRSDKGRPTKSLGKTYLSYCIICI